jgi:hypothetical protein
MNHGVHPMCAPCSSRLPVTDQNQHQVPVGYSVRLQVCVPDPVLDPDPDPDRDADCHPKPHRDFQPQFLARFPIDNVAVVGGVYGCGCGCVWLCMGVCGGWGCGQLIAVVEAVGT